MKLEGIIPELKPSEFFGNLNYIIDKFKPYPVISVNTSSLFEGKIEYLKILKEKYPNKHFIRKDFITIPEQIKESKDNGADLVLLLRNYLNDVKYNDLIDACDTFDIIPLVETYGQFYNLREENILVNSRNLNNKTIHKELAEELCKKYKDLGHNVIYASGEKSKRVIEENIADAVLIGTAFMKGEI